MTVTVQFRGVQATISAGGWSCTNDDLEATLQVLEDTRDREDYDPHPDLTGAEYAISTLKDGKITRQDPASYESGERAVW